MRLNNIYEVDNDKDVYEVYVSGMYYATVKVKAGMPRRIADERAHAMLPNLKYQMYDLVHVGTI